MRKYDELSNLQGSVAGSKEAPQFKLRDLPGYPWLNPCPRCGFRGSCDCTAFERATVAHPALDLREYRA